jgi:KaiC/GvpD/RAD55 family RecA-like ATPase
MEDNLEFKKEEKNMKRVNTGIEGLDELIEGGFPNGSTIVVTGTAGSGKSIFGMQYLVGGLKNDEECLYINIEQTVDAIVDQAIQFGWDFNKWESEGKLKILSISPQQFLDTKPLQDIKKHILENNYDRVVVDSLTSLLYAPYTMSSILNIAEKGLGPRALIEMMRAEVIAFIDFLQTHGKTTVIVSQKIEGLPGNTYDMTSEFKADGLLLLDSAVIGNNLKRNIQVKKLRKTKTDGIPHVFDFTGKGIYLEP